jgi:hypothetical protein
LPQDQVSWTNHSITGTFALVPEKTAVVGQPVLGTAVAAPASTPPIAMPMTTEISEDTPPSLTPSEPHLPPQGFFSLTDLFATGPYNGWTAAQKAIVLKLAQEKLKAQGHYNGNPDGVPGGQTQRALISFQRLGGDSEVSGRFDVPCLAKLGLLGMAPPNTPSPAAVTSSAKRKPSTSAPSPSTKSKSRSGEMSESEFLRRAKALELR